jgi:pyruvate kinase
MSLRDRQPEKIDRLDEWLQMAIRAIIEKSYDRPTLEDFLREIAVTAERTLDAQCCSIFLLDENDTTMLRVREASGELGKRLRSARSSYYIPTKRDAFDTGEERAASVKEDAIQAYRDGELRDANGELNERGKRLIGVGDLPMGITACVVKTGQSVCRHGQDVRKHPEWLGGYEANMGEICTSIMEVPLKVAGDILGVIKIENHIASDRITKFDDLAREDVQEKIKLFGDDHHKVLTTLAECIAVALKKSIYRKEILTPKIVLSAIPFQVQTSSQWIPRTKIICGVMPLNQLGKSIKKNERIDSQTTKDMIRSFISEGMSIARINFSYVRTEEQREDTWTLMKLIREVSEEMKRPVGVLMDLCGPRIRTGKMKNDVTLQNGKRVVITTSLKTENGADLIGDETKFPVTYERLALDVSAYKRTTTEDIYLFIDNGKLRLRVLSADEESLECEVKKGGEVKSDKGINIPHCRLSTDAVTPQDENDLTWIFNKEKDERCQIIDFIALSFVKTANDIVILRGILKAKRRAHIPIIAKIETAEAVEDNRIGEITSTLAQDQFAALMVARGDLAVETSREDVPAYQTRLIIECDNKEIPVIVATEMLESMRRNPYPTRAEVSDVTNAVREGASGVMLAGETTDGDYPVETIKMLATILRKAESSPLLRIPTNYRKETASIDDLVERLRDMVKRSPQELMANAHGAIALSACETARIIKSPALVVCSGWGTTAKEAACQRPGMPIVAITLKRVSATNLLLCRGVYPVLIESQPVDTEELLRLIESILDTLDIGKAGDLLVSTFGAETGVKPLSTNGKLGTNTLRILRRDS